MDNNFGYMDSWCADSDIELAHSAAISSQIRAEVEESVKKGIEASIPGLMETARRELQTSIPALIEREMKIHLEAIPRLVEEAIKIQFRASFPELVLSVIKESQRVLPSVSPSLPAFQSFSPPLTSRPSPHPAGSFDSRPLHLKFVGELPKALFTKDKLKDQGAALSVELLDQSGNRVDSGPESSTHIKILVVNEDLKVEDGFTDEDINKHVVLPRTDKGPLLKGAENGVISLCKGVACIGELAFTDNSRAMRNGKFRLGARVLNRGLAIKGAVSADVQVKEHRNTFNKKTGTLSLKDEVWHLVNVAKKGETHKKLIAEGVVLVEDFLARYNSNNDDEKLLQIFGGSRKKLKETVEMAKSRIQQPFEPQEMLDNSQPQRFDTSYEKQREQSSHIPTEAESVCEHRTAAAYMHPNATGPCQVTGMTPYEAGEATLTLPNSFTPSPGFGDFSIDDFLIGDFSFGDVSIRDVSIDDSHDKDFSEKKLSPRWNPLRAALRFKVAVKVLVRDGPKAGKRQKLG